MPNSEKNSSKLLIEVPGGFTVPQVERILQAAKVFNDWDGNGTQSPQMGLYVLWVTYLDTDAEERPWSRKQSDVFVDMRHVLNLLEACHKE